MGKYEEIQNITEEVKMINLFRVWTFFILYLKGFFKLLFLIIICVLQIPPKDIPLVEKAFFSL